jgi:dUTP pyrophosphatase
MPSVGLGLELAQAHQQQTPAAVVNNQNSWALQNLTNTKQFKHHDQALDWLEQQTPTPTTNQVLVAGEGTTPTKAHQDDAGYDLYYNGTQPIELKPGEAADIPADVTIEWPNQQWGFLLGRSSSFRNRALLVNPAVIDAGYRGPLFAIVRNIGTQTTTVHPGERIAQIVPFPTHSLNQTLTKVQQQHLTQTDRGTQGFGSSGL